MFGLKRNYTEDGQNNMRYNPESDMIQVNVNNEWIDVIKAYAKSKNWIPDVFTDLTNIFGGILFRNGTNGSHNESTYRTDGYIKLGSTTDSNGGAAIHSENKIPLNVYSSVTVKFKQINAFYYNYSKLQFKMRETNNTDHIYDGILLYTTPHLDDTGVMELTLDLTEYNNSAIEQYFCVGIIGNAEIYSVTFNK